jgi:hypothetical protein
LWGGGHCKVMSDVDVKIIRASPPPHGYAVRARLRGGEGKVTTNSMVGDCLLPELRGHFKWKIREDCVDAQLGGFGPMGRFVASDEFSGDEEPFVGGVDAADVGGRRQMANVNPVGIAIGSGRFDFVGVAAEAGGAGEIAGVFEALADVG